MFDIFTEPVDFNQQALLLFARQHKENKLYRKYCDNHGATPSTVEQWQHIPAMPTEGFKLEDKLISFSEHEVNGYFQSSGTTRAVKGRHYHRSLKLYRESIWQGWVQAGLADAMSEVKTAIFLTLSPEQDSHSSLIAMFDVLAQRQGFKAIHYLESLEEKAYKKIVNTIKEQSAPIAIFGPALAYHELQNALDEESLPLAEGSWVLETGGYKGQTKEYKRENLLDFIQQKLSVPQSNIINEYGMCELSSPAYDVGLTGQHQLPPWCKAQVWNWAANRPCEVGEQGYLKLYDLANQDSVIAIATQDWAICTGGENDFILVGRESKAIAKGCSLRV